VYYSFLHGGYARTQVSFSSRTCMWRTMVALENSWWVEIEVQMQVWMGF
jgi:hypothetical protein